LFDRIEALRRRRVTGKQIARDRSVVGNEPFGRARTPALTPNADIKINERVSLRPI